MRLGFPLLLRLVWRSLFRTGGTHAPLTARRFLTICLLLPVLVLVQLGHRLFFLLDDLFFPAYRDVEVRQPVFILGVARSGTTFLHRLLARDTRLFTTMKLWEAAFAPSVTQRKLVHAAARIDRLLASPLRRLISWLDRLANRHTETYHAGSLFQPEEDEGVLLPIFATLQLVFPFPFPEELQQFLDFDQAASASEKQRTMRYYRSCIQRHLYVHGVHRRYLAKSPAFTPKIETMRQAFPDASFVCCVRTPCETVPSCLSLLEQARAQFGLAALDDAVRDFMLDSIGLFYRRPMLLLPRWPAERQAFVRYHELTQTPRATVLALYERLRLPVDVGFDQRLVEEEAGARSYRSRHCYSLEQFGLTREMINREFEDVVAFHRFDDGPAPAAS